MSGMFKPKKPPAPAATPPAPDRSDSEIQSAAAMQRNRWYGSSKSNMANRLTSGLGIPGGSTSSAAIQLLGLNGA